jgi:anti-sigma factor RsiW
MDAMRKALSKVMRPNRRRCEQARSLMSDYVDGELEPAERKRLERHVRFCDRCHIVLGNLRQTLGRLRTLQASDPPGATDADALGERIGRAWRERA